MLSFDALLSSTQGCRCLHLNFPLAPLKSPRKSLLKSHALRYALKSS